MTLPTIVFVPGAWHTCDYYKPVISILTNKGFPTATVNLPSVGGISSMTDDAIAIHKVTSKLAEDGQRIILVMHSYGGIPGTESAKDLSWEIRQANGESGGIIALVYVSAYLIKEGMSVMSVAGDAEWPSFLTKQDGQILYDKPTAIEKFYHDFPQNESPTAWAEKMKPQSEASFSGALSYAAHKDIPAVYLLCEQDRSLPIGLQELFVTYAEGKITTRRCKSGHSPMVTMPDEVVETILLAVEA